MDLMRGLLLETLRRLQGGQVDDGWWRRTLDKLGQKYVAPHFLKMPALQEWLRIEAVEEGMVAMARAYVMGTTDVGEPEVRKQLRALYADVTGEAEHLAEGPIDVVVAVLTAGYIAAIPGDQRPTAAMIQQVDEGVRRANAKLHDLGTTRDPFVQSVHVERVEEELSDILAHRMFDAETATRRVLDLRRQVEDGGELGGATEAVKNRVRYWAARLCAANEGTLEQAREIRSGLSNGQTAESLVVVDALIAASAGDRDRAMQLVRDVDEQDARTVLFSLLLRFDGPTAALRWCEGIDAGHQPWYFTRAGWRMWAFHKAQAGQWGGAAQGLREVERRLGREPGVALIEGTINAALVLPEERRGDVFGSVPLYAGVAPNVHAGAESHRVRALACFDYVAANLGEFTDKNLRMTVEDWRLWLRLMNPVRPEAQKARDEIRDRMADGAAAVGLVPFAWSFGISFDDKPLRARLRQSGRLGGLSDAEVVAECLVNESTLGAREFARYLEDHLERLDRAMLPAATTAMLFESLVNDGQVDRARELVSRRAEHIDAAMSRRMNAALADEAGTDRKRELEALYDESKSLVDLHNLIVYLKEVDDRAALGQRLREMFEKDQSARNAYELVSFLSRRAADHESVLAFLDAYPGLVAQHEELRAARAWALFHAGRFRESREVNEGLLATRRNVNDLMLDVNLGVAGGDWDRLPGVVEREWPHRQESDPEVLIMLARIAGQPGQSAERSLELARLGASKAPEDPRILASAYGIHFELGCDDQADPKWLTQAVEHSTEDGPIWRSDLKEMVERWLPAMRERNEKIEQMLFAGKVPMSLAAGMLNVPLSRVLLDKRRNGALSRDGRHRPVIPVISGVRRPVNMEKDWTVGVDVTSILVLGQIGLLEAVVDALGHVKIASDTMASLFVERSLVRFHQPARVRQAQQLRRLFDRGYIKVVEESFVVSAEAVQEFGIERATLMEASRDNGGIVVCATPLHRAGSLTEEIADISGYEELLFSPADVSAVARRRRGLFDAEVYERAMGFLASQGQVANSDLRDSILDGPVYVDELALSYLQSAKVLEALATGGVDLRVHRSVQEETNALVEGGEAGEDLAKEVERVVAVLRSGLESGAISVLPQLSEAREREAPGLAAVGSLEELVLASGECDALCVDDRYFNSHPASSDPNGAVVPVVCVLDVLLHLRSQNALSDAEYWTARHKLREAGFVFVPAEADELRHWLEATDVSDGGLIESPELRAIRQTVNGVELIRVGSEPELQARSDEMQLVNAQVIRELWESATVDAEAAGVLCTWVWRYLMATTYLPGHSEPGSSGDRVRDSIIRRIGLLLVPRTVDSAPRRDAYRTWVERCVVRQLMPTNGSVAEEAAMTAFSSVANLGEHREIVGRFLLEGVPDALRDHLVIKEPEFARDCGMERTKVIGVAGAIRVAETDLVRAARSVFDGSSSASVVDRSGRPVTVERKRSEDPLSLRWEDRELGTQRVEVPLLTLVDPDAEVRSRTFEVVLESLGPTANLPTDLGREVASRTLSDGEMSVLFREQSSGVAVLHGDLARKIVTGHALSLGDIVPVSLEYWERFCGPSPEGRDVEAWLHSRLIPYRRELLKKNIVQGLDICCLGALRDDLAPGAWLEGVADETVWEALQAVEVDGNPIALLGVLDVALYRDRDERFVKYADDAIGVLLDDSAGNEQGFYRLFRMLCNLGLSHLPMVEGAGQRPGFWRRMCAWMQAGLVARMFVGSGAAVDMDALEQWCAQNAAREGVLRTLVDIREEPVALGGSMGARSLRYDVLRRLQMLKQRHEQAGRSVPRGEEIDSAFAQLAGLAGQGAYIVPGPMELHLRPQVAMPEQLKGAIATVWGDGDVIRALNLVAKSSQCFDVGSGNVERTRTVVRDLAGSIGEVDFEEALSQLYPASIVAAATGDGQIADDLGALAGMLAAKAAKSEDVEWVIHLLLQAAGARGGIEDWLNWLESRFVEVARAMPATPNDCLRWFVFQLEGLEVVMPMEWWFHLTAKRVAIAGLVTAT
ncbi:MAG: hypothetical protein F4X98_12290 [Gammaproteobacteria bacterium]|nr:hypothetical protein [Gammaproteobacteria bacterium]